jgi:IS30 family transposase
MILNGCFTPVTSTGQRNIYTLALEREMLKMKQRARIYYSSEQRNLMWDRWQAGDSMHVIAGLFDRGHSSVQRILSETGGIRPRQRSRSRLALTLSEREEISRGIVAGHSLRSIAKAVCRAPSTVSREVNRNGGRQGYRAISAEQAAWQRSRRRKRCKLVQNRALARIVAHKLKQLWSPEQIAGWLKRTYPEDENYRVSHEIIYRSLYVQARGALKKELIKHLRSKRTMRHSRHGNSSGEGQGQIKDMVRISERPAAVEDRAVPGHWEGDLIVGSDESYIATLVERHTRYVMLAKVNGKDTNTVITALIKQAKKLPRELYKSLTWDRGKELSDHQRFTLATDIDVYFCDPQSPWQRGSNENTNGLLRQYFPKGTDLSVHSQRHLNKVARQLNDRPRKTLEFFSPAEKFNECVASIG